jgi:cytochrome c-type biogenesis protein CcmH
MLLFGLFATLLVIASLATIAWPLLRRERASASPDTDVASLAVYRDQKRALDADLAAGDMSGNEHEAAIGELSRRLAEDTPPTPVPRTGPTRPGWGLASLLIIAIPLAAGALYFHLGNPAAVTLAAIGHDKQDISDKQIQAMVEALAQRLKSNPKDAQGWALLARSYQALERFPEAVDAFAHANELVPDDPGLLVDYADSLAMAQGKSLAGKPSALVQRALEIDPEQRKALALAATGAMEERDLDRAIGYWKRLVATLPPDSKEADQVNSFIAELDATKAAGVPAAPASASAQVSSTAAPSSSRAAAGPAVAAPAAQALPKAKPGPEAIAGRVEIGAKLAGKVAPTDTVFIFARPVDGPRMPLAVLRVPAQALPLDFNLDDSLSMAPTAKLSGAQAVVVEARISKHGSATPQAGDLFGRIDSVKPGTSGLHISIDQVVP